MLTDLQFLCFLPFNPFNVVNNSRLSLVISLLTIFRSDRGGGAGLCRVTFLFSGARQRQDDYIRKSIINYSV